MECIKGWKETSETEIENQSQDQDQDRRNGFCDIFWFPNEFRR